MTPEAIEAKYFVPPTRYRDKAALVGETSDNLPGVPGVGDKTAAKWIKQYGGLDGIIAHVDEIKGKAGESLRAHLADVMRNYDLNALVCDLELPVRPEDVRWHGLGPRGGAPGLRRARVPGAARAAVLLPGRGRARGRVRLRPGRRGAGRRARSRAGSTEHAAAAPVGVAVTGQFGRGTGELTGIAVATGDGPAAWFDPAALDEADEQAVAGWLADPDRPKVIHDAKPAMLAFRAHGWALAGVRRRHRARGLPGQARPAGLRPDRPGPALPEARAAGRRAGDRPAHPRRPRRPDGAAEQNVMLRARATLDLADAITEELSRDEGESQRLLAEVEQPLAVVLGEMEHVGIAADTEYLSELEAHFAAEVKAAAAGGARGGRPRVQPRLAQAAAGDPVHRARPAQDQADQVRLHHRRRRSAEPVRADRRPGAGAPAAAPRRGQAEVHGGRPAQVGLRRRPHPHHVQPDRRGHRPAVVDRPQPAEHPDPHRGGPADPPGVHRRRAASSS